MELPNEVEHDAGLSLVAVAAAFSVAAVLNYQRQGAEQDDSDTVHPPPGR